MHLRVGRVGELSLLQLGSVVVAGMVPYKLKYAVIVLVLSGQRSRAGISPMYADTEVVRLLPLRSNDAPRWYPGERGACAILIGKVISLSPVDGPPLIVQGKLASPPCTQAIGSASSIASEIIIGAGYSGE